ncbi:MAG TPA: glycosyltransferase [Clostridia bacterium]|mgnify:CR=1 FL=1|nr:glycosyltransferase [Clostridia bacterium]
MGMMGLKVVILTTCTGEGHNTASSAIAEAFRDMNWDVFIIDIFAKFSPRVGKFISRAYDSCTTKNPAFFGKLYQVGVKTSIPNRKSIVYHFSSVYAGRVYEELKRINADAVICPHIFCAQAVTKIIRKYGLDIPTMGVITDYAWSPYWEETLLNMYVIADQDISHEFIKRGMKKESLYPLGIPIHKKFISPAKDICEAKANLGLDPDKRHYLVMGGSMGFGDYEGLISALVAKDATANITALCGNNRNLQDSLKSKGFGENVKIFGFADNVDELMDSADVLITKPGGLSTTEAVNKQVPMVLTSPIPGSEAPNIEYYVSRGMALYADTSSKAAEYAYNVVNDEQLRKSIIQAQKTYAKPNASKRIAELVALEARVARGN